MNETMNTITGVSVEEKTPVSTVEEKTVENPVVEEKEETEEMEMKISFPKSARERLYEELLTIIGNQKLNSRNVITITLSLMQIVDGYEEVHGVQKKAVIMNILDRWIDSKVEDEQEKMELKLLVKMTLPSVIDGFIAIDRKQLQIKMKKGFKSLIGCCCS